LQQFMHRALPPPWAGAAPILVWILTWLVLPAAAAYAGPSAALPAARDLAADAQTLRQRHIPLLVLYSRQDCEWCDQARREVLGPMLRNAATPVVIRQIDIDTDAPLVDWDGKTTTHRNFSRRHGVSLTPTVALFGPGGEPLAEPIVGYQRDFYSGLLDGHIEQALAHLRNPPRP
jgi:hypothetical protein